MPSSDPQNTDAINSNPITSDSSKESDYSCEQQTLLLKLARDSIQYGLTTGQSLKPDKTNVDPRLLALGACFVTLTVDEQLRGCIGTLEPHESLFDAVAYYSHQAAFCDPRFSPLSAEELGGICIEISVLSPMESIEVVDEEDLLQKLQPGIDGLWMENGARRATFLPQVWDKIPEPRKFVEQLKLKAGLTKDYWSDQIQWHRYSVFSMEEKNLEREK